MKKRIEEIYGLFQEWEDHAKAGAEGYGSKGKYNKNALRRSRSIAQELRAALKDWRKYTIEAEKA